jgi:type IV pilus assembly protein PilQ
MEGHGYKAWIPPIILGMIAVLWINSPSFSQTQAAKSPLSVLKIEVGATPSGSRVVIEGSRPFEYAVTKALNPLRILVDLPETKDESLKEPIVVKNGVINTIVHKANTDIGKAGTRVEIGLDQSVEYLVSSEGNRMFVDLGRPIEVQPPGKPRKLAAADRPMIPMESPQSKKTEKIAKPSAMAKKLNEVAISTHPDWVEVDLYGDGRIPEFRITRLTKPPRLVFDLPKMTNATSKKKIDVGDKNLKEIRIGQHADRLRVVFAFSETKIPTYDTIKEGAELKVFLGDIQKAKEEKAAPGLAKEPVEVAKAEPPKAALPKETAPLIPPPAKEEEKPREEPRGKEKEEVSKPTAPEPLAEKERIPEALKGREYDRALMAQYRGPRISLDFKDADIHNILRLIADVSNLNIITSEDVKGKITIRLVNVPWEQALDVILTTKNLIKMEEGNVLRITTLESVRKEQEEKQKAEESLLKKRDLRLKLEEPGKKIVKVNYADAAELQRLLLEKKDEGKGFLSPQGSVKADKRTNTLIIQDIRSNLEDIEQVIKDLDTPTPQVLIEARVVQAQTSFVRALGIQWGGSYNQTPGGRWSYGLTGNNPSAAAGWGFTPSATPGGSTPLIMPSNFVVNFPASTVNTPSGGFGVSFGKLTGSLVNLDLRIQMGETDGLTKVIARPKLATLDNKEAYVKQGEKIPYETTSQAGTQVQFIDAVLSLKVTPHVTPDGSILMKVLVTRDARGNYRSPVNQVPSIDNREASTEVLVKDGETLVIGGIYTSEVSQTEQGIPWLMKIPILGWLFKNQESQSVKNELLIFITPTIIQQKSES